MASNEKDLVQAFSGMTIDLMNGSSEERVRSRDR